MYWEHITNQLEQLSLIITDIFLVIGKKKKEEFMLLDIITMYGR